MTDQSPALQSSAGGDRNGFGLGSAVSRLWKKRAGRRAIVGGGIVLILLVILIVSVVMFSSLSHESQSYKDGYSAGGSVASSGASNGTARQACVLAERAPAAAGGIPAGDNPAQWVQGCVAALDNAEADN
jgi:Na+-transporting methylmalonyl-CoA/oxaloacetate decarboxylase gamma subunit